jgi:hypothetical protein
MINKPAVSQEIIVVQTSEAFLYKLNKEITQLPMQDHHRDATCHVHFCSEILKSYSMCVCDTLLYGEWNTT